MQKCRNDEAMCVESCYGWSSHDIKVFSIFVCRTSEKQPIDEGRILLKYGITSQYYDIIIFCIFVYPNNEDISNISQNMGKVQNTNLASEFYTPFFDRYWWAGFNYRIIICGYVNKF